MTCLMDHLLGKRPLSEFSNQPNSIPSRVRSGNGFQKLDGSGARLSEKAPVDQLQRSSRHTNCRSSLNGCKSPAEKFVDMIHLEQGPTLAIGHGQQYEHAAALDFPF
ncbi:hypothetical protein THTE_2339 [Thermogutta terrifontis]|uniref:Uncharacterized protein n=1 Tax=Thermogutta terrifontis TaxID=1331910 RepID=A0A286RG50_9BACT|nr:hypothetical protein THTE_2339 [Thermogutta terrifontis]